jgi:hypothetical protein
MLPQACPDTPPLSVQRATGFWSRLAGLLARAELRKGEALLLLPCRGVHTLFMPYSIDVVFIDRAGRVLDVTEDLAPWRARFCRRAHAVLELRAGQAASYGIAAGALLELGANR